jgi:hypothetical protein
MAMVVLFCVYESFSWVLINPCFLSFYVVISLIFVRYEIARG